MYLIESGDGTVWADASRFPFGPASLLFFVPYQHVRFPYLSGAGRHVVKDAIMMGAALVTMADSATAYLRKRAAALSPSTVS